MLSGWVEEGARALLGRRTGADLIDGRGVEIDVCRRNEKGQQTIHDALMLETRTERTGDVFAPAAREKTHEKGQLCVRRVTMGV